MWRNLASAAESGWDFSSRWFEDLQNLSTIDTTNVVPVDLNAFMCGNLNALSFLFEKAGKKPASLIFTKK
jgi:alpha,alpha-trehalase